MCVCARVNEAVAGCELRRTGPTTMNETGIVGVRRVQSNAKESGNMSKEVDAMKPRWTTAEMKMARLSRMMVRSGGDKRWVCSACPEVR